jgi:hypothetical protein
MMRYIPALVLGSVLLAACSAATGPSSPPTSIAGSWSTSPPGHPDETPAGPAGLLLTQSGDSVTGVSQWTFIIHDLRGTYVRPQITLTYTDSSNGQVRVDTLSGRGVTEGQLVLGGTTYYKQ